MHRREHKTPELREGTNERVGKRTNGTANFDSSLHFGVSEFLPFFMFLDDTMTTTFLPLAATRTPAFSPFSRRRETPREHLCSLAATENVHREGDDGRRYSR